MSPLSPVGTVSLWGFMVYDTADALPGSAHSNDEPPLVLWSPLSGGWVELVRRFRVLNPVIPLVTQVGGACQPFLYAIQMCVPE